MNPASIIEEWMFSTVRINTTKVLGEKFVGTGFLFAYGINEKQSVSFLVTNRHMIENMMSMELHFILEKDGKPDLENTITMPVTGLESHWTFHPNLVDVAIMPFARVLRHAESEGKTIFYRFVSQSHIPKAVDFVDLDAMEEVLFIGYPSGMFDKKNNTPIIRRGSTATHPNLDFDGLPQYLIDATVFGGSSGSPVFIYDNGIHWDKVSRKPEDSRIWFLGIVAKNKVLPNQRELVTKETQSKTEETEKVPVIEENFHLGIVFKPITIVETIEEFAKNVGNGLIFEKMKKEGRIP